MKENKILQELKVEIYQKKKRGKSENEKFKRNGTSNRNSEASLITEYEIEKRVSSMEDRRRNGHLHERKY